MRDSAPTEERAPTSRLIALFLASAGLLCMQIALTKIFSVVLWYHFGFLVISIALLGFAISGVWLSRRPEVLDRGGALLTRLSTSAAIWTCISLFLVIWTKVDAMYLVRDRNIGALVFVIAVLLIPFFFIGAAVSATLTMHRTEAGRVYSANLLGSGAGCAMAVALFDGLNLSAPDVVLASALSIAAGALLFSLRAGGVRFVPPLVVTGALVAAFFWSGRTDLLKLEAPPSKPLSYVEDWEEANYPRKVELLDGETVVFYGDPVAIEAVAASEGSAGSEGGFMVRTPYEEDLFIPDSNLPPRSEIVMEPASLVEFTKWTSLSRVDAFTWPGTLDPWGLWGLSPRFAGEKPRQKGVTIDTWAMTNVLEWDRDAGPPPEIVEYLPAGLVHRIRQESEILCIGAGGGMDLLTAKRFNAKKIVGVEINPSIVEAIRTNFLDFQGHLYDTEDPPGDVRVEVAEGRHYLERDQEKYDIVQLSGVDTASTTQAGAFSLSENFLYTAEAFDTYLEHTKPGGIVTLTRWYLPDPETGDPRNTLRLFALAADALERAEVKDLRKHLYLVVSQGFSVILFGKQPFTTEELAILDAEVERLAFTHLLHPERDVPLLHPVTSAELPNRFEEYIAAEDKSAWIAAYPYDVEPPTDDRPFFFETSRFENLLQKESFLNPLGGLTAHAILVLLLGLVGLAGWFFVLQPLRRLKLVTPKAPGQPRRLPVMIYFACLGLGFILVEVVLSQQFILFLGNPLYSLAVVLFSVLVFSGIGAAWSQRLTRPAGPLLVVIAIAAVYPFVLDFVFARALMLPDAGRIMVSVALLAPLSLALGMPFALGLRRIAAGDASVSAWAWGINGYMSVVGSVMTVVLSIALGFKMVVWIGAGIYLIAFFTAPLLARRGGAIAEQEEDDEGPVWSPVPDSNLAVGDEDERAEISPAT